MDSQAETIDRVRAFSRAYTRQLGLLGKSYLGSGLGLAEARVLHDLDGTGPVLARQLAQDLGMDPGQMSRILAGFRRRGWVEQLAGASARERPLRLTAAGLAEVVALRQASRAAVASALAPLGRAGQGVLAQALDQARAVLACDGRPVLRDLAPGDAGWVIARHAALYARDEGFDASFETLVTEILLGFLRRADPARERGFVAELAGRPLGCVFCMAEGPDQPQVARLRLFLIEPEARGSGLAQQMLEAVLTFARAAGYRQMRLWTHESHAAAGRLYARNGFVLTQSSPTRAFGCDLVDQTWERAI